MHELDWFQCVDQIFFIEEEETLTVLDEHGIPTNQEEEEPKYV